MRKFLQNKLWRNKTADMMEQNHGSIIHRRKLNDSEFESELKTKLLEEANEVAAASSKDEIAEEVADVFEVLEEMCRLHNISITKVRELQNAKNEERGSYSGRQYVTIAEHPEGSFGEEYCLTDPIKYPEVKD